MVSLHFIKSNGFSAFLTLTDPIIAAPNDSAFIVGKRTLPIFWYQVLVISEESPLVHLMPRINVLFCSARTNKCLNIITQVASVY